MVINSLSDVKNFDVMGQKASANKLRQNWPHLLKNPQGEGPNTAI